MSFNPEAETALRRVIISSRRKKKAEKADQQKQIKLLITGLIKLVSKSAS